MNNWDNLPSYSVCGLGQDFRIHSSPTKWFRVPSLPWHWNCRWPYIPLREGELLLVVSNEEITYTHCHSTSPVLRRTDGMSLNSYYRILQHPPVFTFSLPLLRIHLQFLFTLLYYPMSHPEMSSWRRTLLTLTLCGRLVPLPHPLSWPALNNIVNWTIRWIPLLLHVNERHPRR